MGCNCENNKDELRIVRGNSFHLRVQVTARRLDGTVIEDFDLGAAEPVLKMIYGGSATAKNMIVEGNDAIIAFDGKDKLGWYGMEMSGTYDSEAWRWCVEKVFQVVNTNAKGNVPEWAVYLDDTYVVAGSFSMVGVANAVQSDWTETDPESPAFILHKPNLNYYGTDVTQSTSTGTTSITSKGRTVDIITKTAPTSSSAIFMGVSWDGLANALRGKQATLVSGTNIKTVNGESLLGSGDMVIHDAYVRDIDASGLMDVGGKSIEDASIYNDIHAAYTAGKYVCVRLVDSWNLFIPLTDTVDGYRFFFSVALLDQLATYVAIVQETGATLLYLVGNYYTKPSGGIPSSDLASGVQTSLGKADAAIPMPSGGSAGQVLKKTSDGVEWADETEGVTDYDELTDKPQINGITLSGNKSASDLGLATESEMSAIQEVIPAAASSSNQLADKAFVNSSVATNTANYISDNGEPFDSLADLEAYSGPLTNNDYAFVIGTDSAGNTTYTRYKYNASTQTWAEEYVLNNSSFTAAQWDAINSGITSGLVSKLGDLPTATELATALAGKQDVISDLSTIRSGAAAGATAYQIPVGGIPKSDMSSGVQTSLGKADTAYQKPSTGIPASDMASAVQTSLGKADNAIPMPATGTTGQILEKTANGVAWNDNPSSAAIQNSVDDWLDDHSASIGGLTYNARQAILNCFEKVAWIDNSGLSLYTALYHALFDSEPTVEYITATFNAGQNIIYTDMPLTDLRQYITVTAYYSDETSATVTSYTLSGTLNAGTSTITVSYGEVDTTLTISNVVDFYNIWSWSTEFTGVGQLTKNHAIYDNDTYDPRRGFRTKPTAAARFGIGVTRGKQAAMIVNSSEYTEDYPVPIPPTATKVTINVTPATDYLFGYIGRYQAGDLSGYDYTMVNEAASWSYQGTYTCEFTAGENLFLGYNGKKSNGGNYTTSDRTSRVVTITFE